MRDRVDPDKMYEFMHSMTTLHEKLVQLKQFLLTHLTDPDNSYILWIEKALHELLAMWNSDVYDHLFPDYQAQTTYFLTFVKPMFSFMKQQLLDIDVQVKSTVQQILFNECGHWKFNDTRIIEMLTMISKLVIQAEEDIFSCQLVGLHKLELYCSEVIQNSPCVEALHNDMHSYFQITDLLKHTVISLDGTDMLNRDPQLWTDIYHMLGYEADCKGVRKTGQIVNITKMVACLESAEHIADKRDNIIQKVKSELTNLTARFEGQFTKLTMELNMLNSHKIDTIILKYQTNEYKKKDLLEQMDTWNKIDQRIESILHMFEALATDLEGELSSLEILMIDSYTDLFDWFFIYQLDYQIENMYKLQVWRRPVAANAISRVPFSAAS